MKLIRTHPIRAGILGLLFLGMGLYLSDPLNRFAVRMIYEGVSLTSWKNGLGGRVYLPASARPEEVVEKGYGSGFSDEILETRKIWIPFETGPCWAVRLGGGHGQIETVLLDFESGPGSWLVKFYF